MKTVTFPNAPIKMAGNLHLAKDFSEDRSYVAIVCVHSAGGVNEQTAGLYAVSLANEGMVADMSQAFTLLEIAANARTAEAKERMVMLPSGVFRWRPKQSERQVLYQGTASAVGKSPLR